MMIKKLICMFCSLALACSMFVVNAAEDEKPISVYAVDGARIDFDVQPQMINDRVMVPLRAISESMGADVTWDEAEQTAFITKENNTIKIQINNKDMILNNETIELDTPPILSNDRVLVPIRAISEGLLIRADWDNFDNAVILTPVSYAPALKFNFQPNFQKRCTDLLRFFYDGKYGGEMFYIASDGGCGVPGDIIIYLKDNVVTLVFNQPHGRCKTRQLSIEEFQALKTFVQDNHVDSLKDCDTYTSTDQLEYQYLHCTKDTAASFYMYDPRDNIYAELVNKFFDLTKTGDFEIKYDESLYDAKILIKNEDYGVLSIWKKDDDFRVLLLEDNQLIWHRFSNNTVGEAVAAPEDITLQPPSKDIPEEYLYNNYNIKGRFIQKAPKENEYYVVKDQHTLGVLNVKTLEFTPIRAFKDIIFDSINVWVDEKNQKAYIATNYDLLEVPIKVYNPSSHIDMKKAGEIVKAMKESSDANEIVMTINDVKVTKQQFGTYSGIAKLAGKSDEEILNDYIANELMYQQAIKEGYTVSEEEIEQAIAILKQGILEAKQGNTQSEKEGWESFQQYLDAMGITEEEYWVQIRPGIKGGLLIGKLKKHLKEEYLASHGISESSVHNEIMQEVYNYYDEYAKKLRENAKIVFCNK